jgi:hypothetical protein
MSDFPHIHPVALMRMRMLGIEPGLTSNNSGCFGCALSRYQNPQSYQFCAYSVGDPFPQAPNFAVQACEHWAHKP